MTLIEQVLNLPNKEKWMALEALWDSLSSDPDGIESPKWHGEVLEETKKRYDSGEEKSVDWDEAKRRILS